MLRSQLAPVLLALGSVVLGGACSEFYYKPDSALMYIMPDAVYREWLDREVEGYEQERRKTHPATGPDYVEAKRRAVARASLSDLRSQLELSVSGAAPATSAALAPPATKVSIEGALVDAGHAPVGEVVTLYQWHDGMAGCPASAPPLVLDHCLLSLESALQMSRDDRELFLGMPTEWIPLFVFETEVLYVVSDPDPTTAVPVLYASLLSPREVVAFTNILTMLRTWERWRKEALWPPSSLGDKVKAKRFEEIFREENPGAELPWAIEGG